MPEEQVRCNICNVMIGQAEAKDHASTSSHAKRKSKLEEDLKAVRGEQSDGISVVLQWTRSV